MDYDAALEAFFQPSPPDAVPAPTQGASPARRLRDAAEPVGMHDVWCRRTYDASAELGLDFLSGYVWGRSAVLGEAEPAVVAAAFAVFEPGLIAATYEEACRRCSRQQVLTARTEATASSLAEVLGDADVAPVAQRLRAALAGAPAVGRPLFSGLAAQPWPGSPAGDLWRACDLLREHRGDGHVAVCVAAGLDAVEMNVLTELWVGLSLGSYTATRGWSPEAIGAAARRLGDRGLVEGDQLTAEGRRLREELEARTDDTQQAVVDALGSDLDQVVAQLDEWSAACVAAGVFPPDVRKRAAG